MTTLTELQLSVAETQQSITSRKECDLLLKNTNFKNHYQKEKSTELANVLTAQENQKGSVGKTLSLLKKYTLESNKENMDTNSLATCCDVELERAMILLEFQFNSNGKKKNKLITKEQEVYDNVNTMKHKNKFHHKDNQTKGKKFTNSENYVKALGDESKLDYLLMTTQLHETDLGRGIKQSVAGMQTIVEERRRTRYDKHNEIYNNKSEADKKNTREKMRKRGRAIKAIKPHFGALTKAQGKEKTRSSLDGMTIKLYKKKSTQAIDAELKWNGKRWSFTELSNDAKPTARPSRTSSRLKE